MSKSIKEIKSIATCNFKIRLILLTLLIFFIFFIEPPTIYSLNLKNTFSYFEANIILFPDGFAEIRAETSENLSWLNKSGDFYYNITNIFTYKQKDNWKFKFSMKNNFDYFYLSIVMPRETLEINNIKSNINFTLSPTYPFTIVFEGSGVPDISFNYKVKHMTLFPLFYLLITLIVLILSFIFLLLFIVRKKKWLNMLPQIERRIINLLIEGSRYQSQIQKELEIPKATLSRHLLNLEKKGIILRKGGRKNKLVELYKEYKPFYKKIKEKLGFIKNTLQRIKKYKK